MIPRIIILHHSLTKDSKTVSWNPIRKYHMGLMGQSDVSKPDYNYYVKHPDKDIGYHFGIELVEDYYEILVGRMINEIGAHCEGQNSHSVGVCFIGNFDESEVPPEQWNRGIKLVTSLCHQFIISAEKVYGHREFNHNKTCPGTKFNLDGFRDQLSLKLQI